MDDISLDMPDSSIRIPTDLCARTTPRRVSPFDASFFSSMCLGIHHTPFLTWSLHALHMFVFSLLLASVNGLTIFLLTAFPQFLSFSVSFQKDHVCLLFIQFSKIEFPWVASRPPKTKQESVLLHSFSLERR